MKITFLLADGFSLAGGQRVVATYAERLQARGHQVTVITQAPRPLSWRQRWNRFLHNDNPPSASYFGDLAVPHRQLSTHRPIVDGDVPDGDVVIATWWETAEWVAQLSASKGHKVHLIQHHEAFDYLPQERVRAAYRLPLRKAVVAPWLRRLLHDEYGIVDVPVIMNGVDLQQFHAPPRRKQAVPTVGMLYAPVPWKGWSVGMQAFAGARRELPALRLNLFGAQPPAAAALPRAAHFTLRPPQDRLRDIYASCDVWLCCSWEEGFSLPLLEAMVCRCPVVSTRVGAAEAIIVDGNNGYLAEPGDAATLGRQLLRVLKASDEAWLALSDRALSTARRFDWEDATAQFEAFLRTAAR